MGEYEWEYDRVVRRIRKSPSYSQSCSPFESVCTSMGEYDWEYDGVVCQICKSPSYSQSCSPFESVCTSMGEYDWEYDGERTHRLSILTYQLSADRLHAPPSPGTAARTALWLARLIRETKET